MATTEEVDVARLAMSAEIAREDAISGTNVTHLVGNDNYGMPAPDWDYKPQPTMMDYTDQAPMVIEGELPYVEPSVAEASPYGQELMSQQSSTPYSDGIIEGVGAQGDNPSEIFATIRPSSVTDTSGMSPYGTGTYGMGTPAKSQAGEPYGGGVALSDKYSSGSMMPEEKTAPVPESKDLEKARKALKVLSEVGKLDSMINPAQQGKELIIPDADIAQADLKEIESIQPIPILPGETIPAGTKKDPYLGYKASLQREADILKQTAQSELASRERYAERESISRLESAANLERKQAQSDVAFEELRQAMSDLGPLKLDRERYWGSKSTGMKVAAAISLMLVSYGHVKAGGTLGTNPAIKMMTDAVDKDVQAQVIEYNSRTNAVARKQSLYGYFRGRFGDALRSEAATKMRSFDLLKQEVELSGAKSKAPLTQEKVNQAIEMINIKQMEAAAGFGKMTITEQLKVMESNRLRGNRTVDVGGQKYEVNSPEDAKEVRKVIAGRDNFRRAMADLKTYAMGVTAADFVYPSSETRARVKGGNAQLRDYFAKMVNTGGGALSNEDNKRIDDMLRTFTNLASVKDVTDYLKLSNLAEIEIDALVMYAERKAEENLTGLVRNYRGAPKAAGSRPDSREIIRSGDYRKNKGK